MSQYPDPSQYPQYPQSSEYPQQPSPYAVPGYYGGGMPNPRPASVTAIAIIGIILGSLSVLCTAPGFLVNVVMLGNEGQNPIAPHLPRMGHSLVLVQTFQSAANFVLALIMLVCCIAALKLKQYARKVLMPWSIITLLWAIISAVLAVTWVVPEMNKITGGMYRANPAMQGAQQTQQIAAIAGALFTSGLMCVVPLGVLIWWGRPHVRAAFGEQLAVPGAPHPGGMAADGRADVIDAHRSLSRFPRWRIPLSQSPYHIPGQVAPALPYQSWGVPSAPTRPAAVTGLVWTGISLGILWALSAVLGVFANGIMLANGGTNLFMPSMPKTYPAVVMIGFVHSLVSLPFIAVLIFACIAALKLRPGARKTLMIWSVAAIFYAAVTTASQIIWVLPATTAMMQKLQPNNPGMGIVNAIATPMAVVTGLLYCVLPALFLILWSRPHVKAAFETPTPGAPNPPPGYPPTQLPPQ